MDISLPRLTRPRQKLTHIHIGSSGSRGIWYNVYTHCGLLNRRNIIIRRRYYDWVTQSIQGQNHISASGIYLP